jgi:hypothetical protein
VELLVQTHTVFSGDNRLLRVNGGTLFHIR